MARVLILGCGDLGSRLGLRLVAEGHKVFGARRSPQRLPSEIEGVLFDLDDAASAASLPADVDWLFWTGAPSGQSSEEAYRRTYVEGPRLALDAYADRGARPSVIVWSSSTSVYGITDGSTVDERTPANPPGFRGQAVLQGERLAEQFARGIAGSRFHVVRFGGLYGEGREYLINAVRRGSVALPQDGDGPWSNRMHIEDAAAALQVVAEAASTRSQDFSKVLLGVDESATRRGEVLRFLADRLGVTLGTEDPAAPQAARGGDKRCVARGLRELGFRWRYPSYREGYGVLLDSLDE